jgi:hypothetical protein
VKSTTRSQGAFPSELAKGEVASVVTEAVEDVVETAPPGTAPAVAPVTAPAVAPGAAVEPEERPAAGAPPAVETTGIVFVHGIGSQQPGETLLQWSSPLIEGITAWRRWAAPPTDGRPLDPVSTAAIDFTTGLPTITLEIPACKVADRQFPAARWMITENWWAAKVAPPGLSTMASWLGPQGGVGQIVNAILGNRGEESPYLWLAKAAVVPFVTVLAGLVLTVYSLVRGIVALIPIQALRDAAVLRAFDEFLTGWFGDVRILLFDPAQSANIRAGLAKAIQRLRADGCSSIVVVAHSGGAMVSYLTLTDPALAKSAQVDKLITFGEGWNLGLILTPEGAGMADRLRSDITRIQKNLRWRDFWASHDPAPAGILKTIELPERRPARPDAIRSKRVWNRRSLLDDHGTYFDNDEEFTIPVLRELDVPGGWGDDSRFFPPDAVEAEATRQAVAAAQAEADRQAAAAARALVADPRARPPESREPRDIPEARTNTRMRRHRERVALLALWRHLSLSVPVAVIAVVLSFPDRLSELGDLVAARLPRVPFLADAIDWLRDLDSLHLDLPGLPIIDLYPALALIGLATLQAIVLIAVLQLVAAPVGAFHAYPEGSVRRNILFGVETVLAIALVASLVPLFAAPDHGRFLGAGVAAWLPGIIATLLVLGFALGGPELVRWSGSPAVNRLFGLTATSVFVIAIASTAVTIFQRDGLEMAELGYVVIWLAFLVLYRVGHSRWKQWDRVERHAVWHDTTAREVSRTPAVFSSFGFVAAVGALVAYVFEWPGPVFYGLVATALGLIGFAVVIGAISWSSHGDPIAQPPPVESARTGS